DAKLTEAHVSLAGLYYSVEYDWDNAEREFKLALQSAPDNATVHWSYAAYLGSMGRFDGALGEAKRADELAPSLANDITFARIYYSMRRYDEAAEYCKRSLQKKENVLGHFFLGFVYVARHRYGEAIAEFETAAGFSKN